MDTRFTLTLKQLIVLVLVTAVLAAGFVLVSYYLGQRSNAFLSGRSVESEAAPGLASATMPPLPQAMTATPETQEPQLIRLTDDEVTGFARKNMVDSQSLLHVESIAFSDEGITLSGEIDAAGYQGNLEIVGMPYVEARQVRLRITDMQLDGSALPQFMYPMVEAEVNAVFDELTFGYDVQSVELKPGEFLIQAVKW